MTVPEMTRQQVLRWKAGWEIANRLEIEGPRADKTPTKLRRLAMTMVSARLFQSEAERAIDVQIARRRWLKLYHVLGIIKKRTVKSPPALLPAGKKATPKKALSAAKKVAHKKKTPTPTRKKSRKA